MKMVMYIIVSDLTKKLKKAKRWVMGVISIRNSENFLFDVYGVDKEIIVGYIKNGAKIFINGKWAIGN